MDQSIPVVAKSLTAPSSLTSVTSPSCHNSLPPRVQQDWPRIALESDALRGVVTRALGLEISSVFQPIVTPDGQVHGEEALLRARSHGLKISPVSVFRIAAAQGSLVAFDRLARTLHLINFISQPHGHGQLYLNVHPRLLGEVSQHGVVFEEILHSVSWEPSQVTLEFLEDDVAQGDYARLREAVNNYRRRGYGIAIDNFGGQQPNRLDNLWELAPDVVKLDRRLLLRSESSSRPHKKLEKLIDLLHELNTTVVMAGIETETQRQLAIDSGVDLLQGYWLGEPKLAKAS